MSQFLQRIEDAQKSLDETRTDIAEMIGIAEAEERDLSDVEAVQVEELSEKAETLKTRISTLESAEKAWAEREVAKAAPAIVKAQHLNQKERAPGEIIFKQATAAYLAHINKLPLEVAAKQAYETDHGLQAVVKSQINPAATDVAGWAQELTTDANQGFLDLLRGDYVTPQLWSVAGVNLNFDGLTAINIPGRADTDSGMEMASGWTGERDAIPVRKMTTATQQLVPYKWGAISTFSKELSMRSVPAIQGLIQQSLIADTGTKLDNDYLGAAAAVAGYNPAGLMNGVTGTAAATGGATVGDDMLADLQNLVNPFYAANLMGGIRIMMHPSNALAMSLVLYNGTYLFKDELARGQLMGIPVIQSTNVPIDEIQAVVMSAQAVANGAQRIEVSDSATIVEVDDDGVAPAMGAGYPRSPTGAVGGPDGAGTTTPVSSVRSLFQTESVAVKLVQYLSWGTLRANSVNRITGVSYVS